MFRSASLAVDVMNDADAFRAEFLATQGRNRPVFLMTDTEAVSVAVVKLIHACTDVNVEARRSARTLQDELLYALKMT